MGPCNDHELAIARMVDQFAVAGKLDASVVELLAEIMPVRLTAEDREFLVKYVVWRLDNPIVR